MVRLRWGGDRCVFGGKLQHGLQVGGVKSKLEKMMVGFLTSQKNGGKTMVKIDESKREKGEKDILHTFSLCTCLAVRKLMPSGKYGSLCKGLQYCLVLSGKYQHFLQVGISPS